MNIQNPTISQNTYLLDIVIINWRSKDQLITCLESCSEKNLRDKITITVVDNSNEIDSATQLPTDIEFTLILPEKNLGFGGGCNLGASNGNALYLLFLNPDIVFFPETIPQIISMIKEVEISEEVGIIGAQLLNEDRSIQKNVANFPTFQNTLGRLFGLDRLFPKTIKPHYVKDIDYSKKQYVDQVPGAFFLIKRKVFNHINGFDQRFFMYYEDVDFSLRASQAGWRTLYQPSIKVFHQGGGTTNSIKAKRLFYSLHSRVHFIEKHFGKFKAIIIRLGIILIEFPERILYNLITKSQQDVKDTIKAYLMFINEIL